MIRHKIRRYLPWIVWPSLFIGGLFLLGLFCRWAMKGMGDEVTGWWGSIEDPTERGCAYIATAIAAHAVVIAFKTMSHARIKVDSKRRESGNGEADAPGGA